MAQSVVRSGRIFKLPGGGKRGGMAQSVEHIVHIDGVVGSSPTVTTTKPLQDNTRKGFSYSRMSRFNSCR